MQDHLLFQRDYLAAQGHGFTNDLLKRTNIKKQKQTSKKTCLAKKRFCFFFYHFDIFYFLPFPPCDTPIPPPQSSFPSLCPQAFKDLGKVLPRSVLFRYVSCYSCTLIFTPHLVTRVALSSLLTEIIDELVHAEIFVTSNANRNFKLGPRCLACNRRSISIC